MKATPLPKELRRLLYLEESGKASDKDLLRLKELLMRGDLVNHDSGRLRADVGAASDR